MRLTRAELFEAELPRGLALARKALLLALADPNLLDLCRARFRHGEAEHQENWQEWPDRRFEAEIAEEVADVVNYKTMQLVAEFSRGREGEA